MSELCQDQGCPQHGTVHVCLSSEEVRAIQAEELQAMVEEMCAYWRGRGLIVTIEQVPLEPLAMGHHVDKVTVRPVRDKA